MTQDQYSQARGSGYVVRGDVVPENEAEDVRSEESKPRTTFQKVASALRGDKEPDQGETERDQPAANRVTTSSEDASGSDVMAPGSDRAAASPPYVTERDEAAMANTPISQQTEGAGVPRRDYWDEPDESEADNEAVAVTSSDPVATDRAARRGRSARQTDRDAMDHPATEPDMFGTTRRAGDETAEMPAAAAEQPGAATIADVPAARTPTGETTASGVPVAETPATSAPAHDVPTPAGDVPAATDAEAPGITGRHAAATPSASAAPADAELRPGDAADSNLRPGEATGKLGDFSDLTYGNLVPDAERFTAQWQEIQFRFVDDPRGSVTEAAEIVAQITAKMEAAIQERQRAIEERQRAIAEQQRSLRGRWGEDTNADTEALRETLRMYKTFLDQLIGSRTS
ncbi:MAG TPA: hypothetical protein VFO01_13400 [Trebonia sp.]|nr:hypothetical protein [Trebonia sp.]